VGEILVSEHQNQSNTRLEGLEILSLHGFDRAIKALSRVLPNERNSEAQQLEVLALLERASQTGETDPRTVEDFVLRHVLPKCCRPQKPWFLPQRYRELLLTWLESLPQSVLQVVRSQVLSAILQRLRKKANDDTLYTLSVIGVRNEETLAALRRVARNNNIRGDRALRLFAVLNPLDGDRDWVSTEIGKRLHRRVNEELLTAAQVAADVRLVSAILGAARKRPYTLFAVGALIGMCRDAPGDGLRQRDIWRALNTLREHLTGGWTELLFNGSLLASCNLAEAVTDVLTALPSVASQGEIHFYRWCDRLDEIRTRTQVEGWKLARVEKLRDHLKARITMASAQVGNFSTLESRLKLKCIDTALCLGDRALLTWSEDAIGSEENLYVQHEVLERLAVLSFENIPQTVLQLLNVPIDRAGSSHEPIELRHLGAAKLAATSTNLSSLGVLIGSLAKSRSLYTTTIDCISDLACFLLQRDRVGVESLLRHAITARESHGAVLVVLEVVRRNPPLGKKSLGLLDEIVSVACDASFPWFVRERALLAVEACIQSTDRIDLISKVQRLATDAHLRVRGAATLAMAMGCVPNEMRAEVDAWVTELEAHRAIPNDRPPSNIAGAIGILLARDPTNYEEAALRILRNRADINDEYAEGLLWGFTRAMASQQRLPTICAEQVADKVERNESRLLGNQRLLGYLATLAPVTFLRRPWELIWKAWMPESRKEVADRTRDAAALLSGDGESNERAVSLLRMLLVDPSFVVRRSAARALAMISPVTLMDWCKSAAQSDTIAVRRLAASACGWQPTDSDVTLDNDILRRLLADVEKSVREAADRARREARHRRWAGELLSQLRQSHPDPNERVLRAFAASRALANVGDDDDLNSIQSLLRDEDLAPNVRYWLENTYKLIQKKWQELTKKWPEPWTHWEGRIEHFEGTFKAGTVEYSAAVTVWLRTGFGDELSEWGGSATLHNVGGRFFVDLDSRDTIVLTAANRADARVVLTEVSGDGFVVFKGSGHFPTVLL
jgi:hypothetical protein